MQQKFLIVVFTFIAVTGVETRNRFIVKNSMGQQVYYATESRLTILFYHIQFNLYLTAADIIILYSLDTYTKSLCHAVFLN